MFIGIICIVIGITNSKKQCPTEKVIYKYLPRTFEDEQNSPVYVSDIFKTMFSRPDVWVATINEMDVRKREDMNNYFISKM